MTDSTPITLTNGEFNANLSPLDRGLAYGDGLFETVRVSVGRTPLWSLHRARLIQGAKRLDIPLDVPRIEQERAELLRRRPGVDGVLKLIVTRGCGGRAYLPPAQPLPSYSWQLRPGVLPAWAAGQQGVALYECRHRLGDNPALAGIKHLNRLEYVLARMEWGDDYPEGLLYDGREHLIEGTLSNVFVRLDGQWCTPRLDRNGVAGVMRRLVRETLLPAIGERAQERTLSRRELLSAQECFVCNSVFGIWPVIGLAPGGEQFPVGVETQRLQRKLTQFLGGAGERQDEDNPEEIQ